MFRILARWPLISRPPPHISRSSSRCLTAWPTRMRKPRHCRGLATPGLCRGESPRAALLGIGIGRVAHVCALGQTPPPRPPPRWRCCRRHRRRPLLLHVVAPLGDGGETARERRSRAPRRRVFPQPGQHRQWRRSPHQGAARRPMRTAPRRAAQPSLRPAHTAHAAAGRASCRLKWSRGGSPRCRVTM